MMLFRDLALVISVWCMIAPRPASAETNRLACEGQSVQGPVVIEGQRRYEAYNALGDGYVSFVGQLATGQMQGRIQYEGYTNTAPFEGLIIGQFAPISISVLDNTGGEMIIYDGTPSLGPPEILARLICNWL